MKKLVFDVEVKDGKIVLSAGLDSNQDGQASVEGEIKIDLKELLDEVVG